MEMTGDQNMNRGQKDGRYCARPSRQPGSMSARRTHFPKDPVERPDAQFASPCVWKLSCRIGCFLPEQGSSNLGLLDLRSAFPKPKGPHIPIDHLHRAFSYVP